MSLDILGKLAQAALLLRKVGELRAAKPFDACQAVDRRIAFAMSGRNVATSAWAVRSQQMSFVLPLVGGFSSDYLPVPRAPGLFKVPTSGPISMTPVLHVGGKQLVAAGAPIRVEHRSGETEVEYSGWAEAAAGPDQPARNGANTPRCEAQLSEDYLSGVQKTQLEIPLPIRFAPPDSLTQSLRVCSDPPHAAASVASAYRVSVDHWRSEPDRQRNSYPLRPSQAVSSVWLHRGFTREAVGDEPCPLSRGGPD